jgi:hypothetical protein
LEESQRIVNRNGVLPFHVTGPAKYPDFQFGSPERAWAGFKWGEFSGGRAHGWEVVIPYRVLVIVAALLPAAWLRRQHRLAVAARAGLCPACGYDLRATPDRCPECGREAARKAGNVKV